MNPARWLAAFVLVGLALLTALFLVTAGWRWPGARPTGPPIAIDDDEPIEKHSVQVRRTGHWTAARWFNCTGTRHSPLQVSFRVSSHAAIVETVDAVASLELRAVENNVLIKHVDSELRLEPCANMEKRTERAYDGKGTWSEVERFPPPVPSWEGSLLNPFGVLKDYGTYFVLSQLKLDDGSVFQFDPIKFTVLSH
jgi:hypothetical protein